MKKLSRLLALASLLALLAVVAPMVARALDPAPAPAADKTDDKDAQDTFKQLRLFADVLERVRADYVDPVTDEKLIENALNGMLSSLDPHSSYMNKKSFQEMQTETKGEFGGLGMEVTMDNGIV